MKSNIRSRKHSLGVAFLSVLMAGIMAAVPGAAEDPLEISDIVLRGIVEHAEPTQLSVQGSQSPVSLEGVAARIRVLEVLRGQWSEPEITVTVLHDPNSVAEGREYIFCARYFKQGEVFVTAPHLGIYDKTASSSWVRYLGPEADRVSIVPETLSNSDVRARVDKGSLDNVTSESSLVVAGRIIAAHDSAHDSTMTTRTHRKVYKLAVEQVLKGRPGGTEIEFVIPTTREFNRDYSVPKVLVGQEWLLFLQAGEAGLYPFAGNNSFLRIEGDKLFYNDVEFSRSYSKTAQVIREMQK